MPRPFLIGAILLVIYLGDASLAQSDGSGEAQQFFPRQGFMLSGYGGAGYNVVFSDNGTPNNFSTIFAPIMLFQISDRFLFEGEFEFEIEEGVTATELEYAQVDIGISNNLTFVAGKFLLPFNTFSERLHPTWINRLISAPALYGGHGALTPTAPLLPVLSDIGIQLRGAFDLGEFRSVTAELFVTQGPVAGGDLHDEGTPSEEEGHDEGQALASASRIASAEGGPDLLAFGSNVSDNNENKMVGARLGFGKAPFFEVNASAMSGAYDDAGELRFSALGAHFEGRYNNFTIHSEIVRTRQDLAEVSHEEEALSKGGQPTSIPVLNEEAGGALIRDGYWAQLSYRHGKWQPVIRWTQVFEGKYDGEELTEGGSQIAIGIDYWIDAALALKVEYLINNEHEELDNNRVAIQLAFGF